MDIVKLSWSGGKDSTAAALLHIQRGDAVKMVYYIPYLTDDIPLIMPQHYEFIQTAAALLHIQRGDAVKMVYYIPYLTDDIPLIMPQHYEFIQTAAARFAAMGAQVYQACGITYWQHVHTIKTRGANAGKPRGYALGFGFCGFRNYSKIPALNRVNVGVYDYQDIGIASDEIGRQFQLNDKKRSILVDCGITETAARKICTDNNLLSPIYSGRDSRDGCAICPYAPPERLQDYVNAYPGARDVLLAIDKFCMDNSVQYKIAYDASTFSERLQLPYQYSFFDGGFNNG